MANGTSTNRLWQFNGGLHLEEHKAESTWLDIRQATLPHRLVLPLQQHIGEPAEPVVQVGDRVLTGQVIARAQGYISVPLHASSSGTVTAIGNQPVPHPSGLEAPCIVIDCDGKDEWVEHEPLHYQDLNSLDPSALRNVVRNAGIVGLGGAGFPSFIKLNPGRKTVDVLILNGAECEPYISCDDMTMRERPVEIIAGARIMQQALKARRCIIGVEDNKPEAINALQDALGSDDSIELVSIPTIYPTGGEKQIIKVLTGMEVPSQGLPIDIGVVCHNIGTAMAVYRSISLGVPLISRIVTITGSAVARPCNLEVRIGTPMSHLLDQCDTDREQMAELIMGGPMMGVAMHNIDVPITKVTNCLLARRQEDIPAVHNAMPCIRCGECARACPVNLLPQQMYWYAHSKNFEKIQQYSLFDCIECGCCAHVCPSHIPLVQYYRFAKTTIWEQEREKKKSDHARRRHEFRLERLEREKAERAEKRKQKLAALEKRKDKGKGSDDKQAVIQAALERARKKKEQSGVLPRNTDNLSPGQSKLVQQVDERRKQAQQPDNNKEPAD
jgi:electron transport complex protein RnfC